MSRSRTRNQTVMPMIPDTNQNVPATESSVPAPVYTVPQPRPTTTTEVWSALFQKDYPEPEDIPRLEDFPDARYIVYKLFNARHCPRLMGYVQFNIPKDSEELQNINHTYRWTKQSYTNFTTINYIKNLRDGDNVVPDFIELGMSWPQKIITRPALPDVASNPLTVNA